RYGVAREEQVAAEYLYGNVGGIPAREAAKEPLFFAESVIEASVPLIVISAGSGVRGEVVQVSSGSAHEVRGRPVSDVEVILCDRVDAACRNDVAHERRALHCAAAAGGIAVLAALGEGIIDRSQSARGAGQV